MKKFLVLFLAITLLLTGCKKNDSEGNKVPSNQDEIKEEANNKDNEEETDLNSESNKEESKTEETKKEEVSNQKTEDKTSNKESTTSNKTNNNTTTNNNNTTTNNTNKDTTTNNNANNNTTNDDKKTCTAKKFDHKYSYVFDSDSACQKGGNTAFLDLVDNGDEKVFAYGCKKIKDECGTEYYGVIFYEYDHELGKEVVVYK